MAQEPIWPGSGSAVSGNTPFGFYDTDSEFQSEAPKFATWCAQRLGYPLMNVELQDKVDSYESKIDSFPERLRKEKLSIYLSLDDTISRVDRGPQLMGLHKMIKDSVKSLQE